MRLRMWLWVHFLRCTSPTNERKMKADRSDSQRRKPEPVAPKQPWTSFRRLGADIEAQGASQTWTSLRSLTAPLLEELLHRRDDLYQAETVLSDSMKLTFIPRIVDCRNANRSALDSARWLQLLLSSYAVAEAGEAEEEEEEEEIVISLKRSELKDLQMHVSAWINHSQRMRACCESAITATKKSNNALAGVEAKLRDFIYNLWGFMAERSKAFPPYFSHLGPLQPSLYGMGRVPPSPPVEATNHNT